MAHPFDHLLRHTHHRHEQFDRVAPAAFCQDCLEVLAVLSRGPSRLLVAIGSVGGSCSASLAMGGPWAAACRARPAPEEWPYTDALPPAWAMRAPMSSISRSTAYGAVSPLSPRPRRS